MEIPNDVADLMVKEGEETAAFERRLGVIDKEVPLGVIRKAVVVAKAARNEKIASMIDSEFTLYKKGLSEGISYAERVSRLNISKIEWLKNKVIPDKFDVLPLSRVIDRNDLEYMKKYGLSVWCRINLDRIVLV